MMTDDERAAREWEREAATPKGKAALAAGWKRARKWGGWRDPNGRLHMTLPKRLTVTK